MASSTRAVTNQGDRSLAAIKCAAVGRSLDELLGDHPEPEMAVRVDQLRRAIGLSVQDTDRLEAEGYLDPVYVEGKDFVVAGKQAERLITLVQDARKLGSRFPPARPAIDDAPRNAFLASGAERSRAAELLEPFRYSALHRVWPRLVELAAPALRLRAVRPARSSRTRLGGVPDLPQGVAWPQRGESPLSFIAQVDLSQVSRAWPSSPLPATGLLSFFYDATRRPWGFSPGDRGAWAVYHFDQKLVRPAEPPDDLPEEARFRPLATELFGELKLPAAESKEVEDLDLRLKEQTAYWALLGDIEAAQKDDGQPVHRLLGHPDPVQGDMEAQSQLVTNGMGADSDGWDRDRERRLLKEKGVWRMLLQVDSDERTNMQWGDAGRIYYWIRQADFAARRWNESWLHLQCF